MANNVGGLSPRELMPQRRQVGAGDTAKDVSFYVNLDTVNAVAGLLGSLVGNEKLAQGDLIPTASALARREAAQQAKEQLIASTLPYVGGTGTLDALEQAYKARGFDLSGSGGAAAPMPAVTPASLPVPPQMPGAPAVSAGLPAPAQDNTMMALNAALGGQGLPAGVEIADASMPLSGYERGIGLSDAAPQLPTERLAAQGVPPEAAPFRGDEEIDVNSLLALAMGSGGRGGVGGTYGTSPVARSTSGALEYYGKSDRTGGKDEAATTARMLLEKHLDSQAQQAKFAQEDKWEGRKLSSAENRFDDELAFKRNEAMTTHMFNVLKELGDAQRSGDKLALDRAQARGTGVATAFGMNQAINKAIQEDGLAPDSPEVANLVAQHNQLAAQWGLPTLVPQEVDTAGWFGFGGGKKTVLVPVSPEQMQGPLAVGGAPVSPLQGLADLLPGLGGARSQAPAANTPAGAQPGGGAAGQPAASPPGQFDVNAALQDLFAPAQAEAVGPQPGGMPAPRPLGQIRDPEFEAKMQGQSEFESIIQDKARKYNLPPELIRAVIAQESRFNPKALSPAGAAGLMQIMPQIAEAYGIGDRYNPNENIEAGARLLREELDRFKDVDLAIAAYNAGSPAVKRAGNKIPEFKETQDYVKRVKAYLGSQGRGTQTMVAAAGASDVPPVDPGKFKRFDSEMQEIQQEIDQASASGRNLAAITQALVRGRKPERALEVLLARGVPQEQAEELVRAAAGKGVPARTIADILQRGVG